MLREAIEAVAFNTGNSLKDQQLTHEGIPVIVDKCIRFVYSHGCMTEGKILSSLYQSFKTRNAVKLHRKLFKLNSIRSKLHYVNGLNSHFQCSFFLIYLVICRRFCWEKWNSIVWSSRYLSAVRSQHEDQQTFVRFPSKRVVRSHRARRLLRARRGQHAETIFANSRRPHLGGTS